MNDICCIGHITLDKIITPKQTIYMPGGTSYYFSHGISHLNDWKNYKLVTLGGICFCLIGHDYLLGAIITFAALVGSLMVSYVRARAEGLGLECKIGFMQRPERVVLTSLGLLICGIVATQNPDLSFDPMLILIVPMGFIAIFANITAFARIEYSRRQLMKK